MKIIKNFLDLQNKQKEINNSPDYNSADCDIDIYDRLIPNIVPK